MYTRRSFLAAAGLAALSGGAHAFALPTSDAATTYADVGAADQWMQKWMASLGSVSEALHLGRFADPMYFLRKDIGWTPNPGQSLQKVRVPSGFVTDFASIPRIFWSVLRPDGDYTYPAIIHDFLYWDQSTSRVDADLVLKYAMQDFRVDASASETIYRGVRVGGKAAWDGNAKLKRSGERRVLKVLPSDPTLRWKDWKVKPGVF